MKHKFYLNPLIFNNNYIILLSWNFKKGLIEYLRERTRHSFFLGWTQGIHFISWSRWSWRFRGHAFLMNLCNFSTVGNKTNIDIY